MHDDILLHLLFCAFRVPSERASSIFAVPAPPSRPYTGESCPYFLYVTSRSSFNALAVEYTVYEFPFNAPCLPLFAILCLTP